MTKEQVKSWILEEFDYMLEHFDNSEDLLVNSFDRITDDTHVYEVTFSIHARQKKNEGEGNE